MGGAVIVDPKTGRLLWGKPLEKSSVDAMLKLLRHYSGEHFVGIDVLPNEPVVELRKFVADKHTAYVIYVIGLEHEDAQRLISDVSKIDGTVAHPTLSWSRGKTDVHITHRDATKEHGIKKLMELLGLRKEDVIGVGDSANDLPIFQAVGHRVAVGNGSEELKAQADEIAPPVDEDGLAQVIEKYFLR